MYRHTDSPHPKKNPQLIATEVRQALPSQLPRHMDEVARASHQVRALKLGCDEASFTHPNLGSRITTLII